MQEQVNEKSVAIAVKAAKLTGRLLAKAMQDFLKKRPKRGPAEPAVINGKQSLKSLTKQGASLSNIEVTGDNIGSFKKTARKYNIDFSLKRDNSGEIPKWIVFFKAKDADALTAAFKEYSKIQLKHKERKPSMLNQLEKAKELAKEAAPPVKKRDIGGHEL